MTPAARAEPDTGPLSAHILSELRLINGKLDSQAEEIASLKRHFEVATAKRDGEMARILADLDAHTQTQREHAARLKALEDAGIAQAQQNKLIMGIGGLVGTALLLALVALWLKSMGLTP